MRNTALMDMIREKCMIIRELQQRERDQKIKDNNLKLGKKTLSGPLKSLGDMIRSKVDRKIKVSGKYHVSMATKSPPKLLDEIGRPCEKTEETPLYYFYRILEEKQALREKAAKSSKIGVVSTQDQSEKELQVYFNKLFSILQASLDNE